MTDNKLLDPMTNMPFSDDIIRSGKTAITRSRPSVPARMLAKLAKPLYNDICIGVILKKNENVVTRRTLDVLDYGGGKGADVKYLNTIEEFSVNGYDPIHGPRIISSPGGYDVVLSTYVLNTLPETKRYLALSSILEHLKRRAWMNYRVFGMFTVRTAKDIERSKTDKWTKLYDGGYLTTKDTYQYGFTQTELASELLAAGFGQVHVLRNNPLVVAAFALAEASWLSCLGSLSRGKESYYGTQ